MTRPAPKVRKPDALDPQIARAASPAPSEVRVSPRPEVGLCSDCVHARRIASARGSEFWLCRRSEVEPERFAKYPALPVRRCPGYTRA
jgi:hypothetical protein